MGQCWGNGDRMAAGAGQKDTKHQRITSQIALIEDELAALTVVEIDRREFRQGEELVSLGLGSMLG